MIHLTKEQEEISDLIIDYAIGRVNAPYIAVSGYAGTGKTTVLGYAAAQVIALCPKKAIAYCAPTGKAASVLQKKLQDFGALNKKSLVHTIHGHIYKLLGRNNGTYNWAKKSSELPYELIVVDEASMVTSQMFRDLLSFKIPIVFIGDSGQLPPINDKPFAPLQKTPYSLKTVHRQALENPIISVATDIRNGEEIPFGSRKDKFLKISREDPRISKVYGMMFDAIEHKDTIVLCGMNNTRIDMNKTIRNKLGYTDALPMIGEHIMCFRNDRNLDLFNGQIYTVTESLGYGVNESCYYVRLENNHVVLAYTGALNINHGRDLGRKMNADAAEIQKNCSRSLQAEPCIFDYGYACSVHKAQGSEWDNVFLYDERSMYMSDEEHRQWLYTGVTRARNSLVVLAA